MGAKGLGDALLVIDYDVERRIRCSVEVSTQQFPQRGAKCGERRRDEDRIAKSKSFNCELERGICIVYFSGYLL